MKPFLSIIAFLLLTLSPLAAQEYDSPEYVSFGRTTSRSKIIAYPSAEEAMMGGAGAVRSQYLRPIGEWTRTDEADATVFTSQYAIPFSWLSRLATLYVDEASGAYEVLINGKKVGYTSNAFSPSEFDVTKASREDMNTIQIRVLKEHWSQRMEDFVASREPRVGEVYVMSQPTIRVRDVVHNTRVDMDNNLAIVEVGMVVKTESLNPKKARIHYELIAPDTTVVTYGHRDIELNMRGEDTVKIMAQIPYDLTWCADRPVRYRLNVKTQIEGRYAEYQSHLIGFRSVETNEAGEVLINGVKTELAYREMDAMTVTDEDLLTARVQKYNAVRFKTGAVPQEVYRMCDSLGVYVVTQIPINTSKSGTSRRVDGNPSNDPAWKQAYLDRVETAYRTTRGNACVIGYFMAEESANGINLYESYLRLKALEQKRPIIYLDAAGEWNSD